MYELSGGKHYLPPHLQLLNKCLLKVAFGQIKRLMVTMPPRHGKSTLCSQTFPAWFLGTFPQKRVILASYESNFASSWGRKARDAYTSAYNADWFTRPVRRDVSAQSEWELQNSPGGMITAGVGGAITGYGADLLLIDDPVKNAAEASSETYRDNAWEWYTSTALTRLEPQGGVVLVMTRWHHDDLGGRILSPEYESEDNSEAWTVINIPALAEEDDVLGREPGEALWPERYTVADLKSKESTLGPYHWSALYQQQPIPREGGMFKPEWFDVVESAPKMAKSVRYWDRGATSDGDPSVGVRMGEKDGVFYIEDVRRFQETSGTAETLIVQTAELDGQSVPIFMEQEPGSSGKDVIHHYTKKLSAYGFRGDRVTGSKEQRAIPFSAQCEAGNVKLVRGPWNRGYLDELAQFPRGAHDDQVDASTGAYNKLHSDAQPRAHKTDKRENRHKNFFS